MIVDLCILNFKNFSNSFKLFFKKLLLFFLPMLFMIIAFNYFIDPAHIFCRKYEEGIANYFLQGYNVANVSNYDENLVQKYYINGLSKRKDVVVIGSSRSMQIRANLFPRKSFFNSSVSSANLQNYMYIFGIYKERNMLPSLLILGFDPWILNRKTSKLETFILPIFLSNDFMFKKYYEFFLIYNRCKRYSAIVSISYFKEASLFFVKSLKKERQRSYYPTKFVVDEGMRFFDGSLLYPKSLRAMGILEVRELAIDCGRNPNNYGLALDYGVNPDRLKKVKMFMEILSKDRDNLEVVIFLAPLHPKTYEILIKSNYKINEAEECLKKLAKMNNITVIGSYNPADCSAREEDFYDGVHPKEEAVKKIFDNYNVCP